MNDYVVEDKRAAIFSVEWDRLTGGWSVVLLTGDMTPAAAVPDGSNVEVNALKAALRAAGFLRA